MKHLTNTLKNLYVHQRSDAFTTLTQTDNEKNDMQMQKVHTITSSTTMAVHRQLEIESICNLRTICATLKERYSLTKVKKHISSKRTATNGENVARVLRSAYIHTKSEFLYRKITFRLHVKFKWSLCCSILVSSDDKSNKQSSLVASKRVEFFSQ